MLSLVITFDRFSKQYTNTIDRQISKVATIITPTTRPIDDEEDFYSAGVKVGYVKFYSRKSLVIYVELVTTVVFVLFVC